jgi:Domain of unknown function (DUF4268)
MFGKEESKRIRQEFWISFGKSFPRKWILYHTKIKEVHFKFYFDTVKARVSIDFEDFDLTKRRKYFEKFLSLRKQMLSTIPDLVFSESYGLENGKQVSSIYIELQGVSIHNRQTWQETMYFLKDNMENLEAVWYEYEDFIKS